MELTLDTILYKLRDLDPVSEIGTAGRRVFSGVKHLGYPKGGTGGSYLLVGRLSEVLRTEQGGTGVYLCVCDMENSRTRLRAAGLRV